MYVDLQLIRVIAETGSFARAGERVGLTQSGVSRAIARLEERIGVRLFDRNARAVTLTDEGRAFHERIAPHLSAIADAFDTAASAKELVRGRLRVNADPFFARYVLAPRLGAFLARYPDVELDLVARDNLGNFVGEGFDVAVRLGEPLQQGLVARLLLRSRVITCAAPSYIARHGKPEHPRDLEAHECILYRDPQTGQPFEWLAQRGRRVVHIKARGRLLLNDFAASLAVALSGHGIFQPLELGVREHLRTGALVDLFPDWPDELFPAYALYPSKHLPPAKVRAFLDFVTQAATEWAP